MQIFVHHINGTQTVVDTTCVDSLESLQQLLGLTEPERAKTRACFAASGLRTA